MKVALTVEELPLSKGVSVITSNEDGIVALDKPVKVLSHPNTDNDRMRSLLDAAYYYDEEVYVWKGADGVERRAWLVNRLDSGTSGVILLALDKEIATIIKQRFSTHKVHKMYYALVKNRPPNPTGIWADKLRKDIYNAGRVMKKAKIVAAKTRFQEVNSPLGGFPIALMKLMPVTGRTHQLRVQCSRHGHPIIGDRSYGSFSFNREVVHETQQRRMMLHSAETTLSYAYKGKMCEFKAVSQMPEPFRIVLDFRPGLNHGRTLPTPEDPKLAPDKRAKAEGILADRRFKTT
ncbi:MAG: RluA family pseudouridine synthase [Lentimonas sp.]